MANEEQRKAFASYIGTGGTNAQPTASTQYPGAAATGTGNPYLFQQFPGVGTQGLQSLPAAPTPPPAAASSIASFPGYQGGAGYSQAGLAQGLYGGAYGQAFGQNAFPQRPPPLGQGEGVNGLQSTQQPPYSNYNSAWQYTDSAAQQSARLRGEPASSRAMIPSSRNYAGDIVESRSKHLSERYHYRDTRPPATVTPPAQVEESTVPVLLCHTCSVCGRMRSAGYHRHHPVVPGRPLVLSACRKCKKKGLHRSHSYTRIRSCTADKPCDWPRESFRHDLDEAERRGRQRHREEVYVRQYSRSRPHVVQHEASEANIGLRVLQQDYSPSRVIKNETRVRVSSLSPGRASRYGEIWPPPDIVRMTASSSHESRPNRSSNPNTTSRDEVWPPPDVVHTHRYRKVTRSPLRRQSSRIIELSPSPSPVRRRSTRVVYRSTSRERRMRSVSPPPISVRETRRSEDAEARVMSHPRAYRPVLPSRSRYPRVSDDTSSFDDTMPSSRPGSPGRSILKHPGGDRETLHRRMSMRDSQQSTTVEVGGPRVHFGSERGDQSLAESRGRSRYIDDRRRLPDGYQQGYFRNPYIDERPAPPLDELERLQIRRSTPSPLRSHEEELRADRARRLSPSPPPPRRYDPVRVRRVSPPPPPPPPPRNLDRTPRPLPRSPSPVRGPTGYRYIQRTRSLTPPRAASRRPASDHTSDSDSVPSGEVTEVRRWRGIDENGKPATFVEERREVRRIDQGSERDGIGEYRRLGERVGGRGWRDV